MLDVQEPVWLPLERREARGIGDSPVRLSVGIGHVDDLNGDLDQALAGSAEYGSKRSGSHA